MLPTIKAQAKALPNIGYLLVDLPADIMAQINEQVTNVCAAPAKYAPANYKLAGALKEEYNFDLPPNVVGNIQECGRAWSRAYGYEDAPLELRDLWVNLQRKHEFNPIHDHDGYLSFVIWVKIPYNLEDELAMFPHAGGKETSKFGFVYTTATGAISTEMLPVDKTWEGRMAIFPSKFAHCVYPFYTSDELRISISGNLYIK
jgi:hypothetical protein